MKVFGVVIIVVALVIAYIGITGSQHRVMAILKGTKLTAPSNAAPAAPNPGGSKGKK